MTGLARPPLPDSNRTSSASTPASPQQPLETSQATPTAAKPSPSGSRERPKTRPASPCWLFQRDRGSNAHQRPFTSRSTWRQPKTMLTTVHGIGLRSAWAHMMRLTFVLLTAASCCLAATTPLRYRKPSHAQPQIAAMLFAF